LNIGHPYVERNDHDVVMVPAGFKKKWKRPAAYASMWQKSYALALAGPVYRALWQTLVR
jgi:hypothetical protein